MNQEHMEQKETSSQQECPQPALQQPSDPPSGYQPYPQPMYPQPGYPPYQQPVYPQPMYQQPVYVSYPQPTVDPRQLVRRLSSLIKTEAAIWIITAAFPLLIGLTHVFNAISSRDLIMGVQAIPFLFLFFVDMYAACSKLRYSRRIVKKPTGIVSHYMSLGEPVVMLIYGIFFGMLFGIIAGILGLTNRSFVMKNQQAFLMLEQSVKQQRKPSPAPPQM